TKIRVGWKVAKICQTDSPSRLLRTVVKLFGMGWILHFPFNPRLLDSPIDSATEASQGPPNLNIARAATLPAG
ncbi:MAG: hypothetical protein P8I27_05505, partial [Pirellulaceae bacterium]|nr:hypothetical protein [Pirellulaceae bacterium]